VAAFAQRRGVTRVAAAVARERALEDLLPEVRHDLVLVRLVVGHELGERPRARGPSTEKRVDVVLELEQHDVEARGRDGARQPDLDRIDELGAAVAQQAQGGREGSFYAAVVAGARIVAHDADARAAQRERGQRLVLATRRSGRTDDVPEKRGTRDRARERPRRVEA